MKRVIRLSGEYYEQEGVFDELYTRSYLDELGKRGYSPLMRHAIYCQADAEIQSLARELEKNHVHQSNKRTEPGQGVYLHPRRSCQQRSKIRWQDRKLGKTIQRASQWKRQDS